VTEVEVRCPEKVENQVRSSAGLRFVIVWIKGEIVGFNPNYSIFIYACVICVKQIKNLDQVFGLGLVEVRLVFDQVWLVA